MAINSEGDYDAWMESTLLLPSSGENQIEKSFS